jgi:uncharacterized membrane protein YdbT with pleckstrin-like domain
MVAGLAMVPSWTELLLRTPRPSILRRMSSTGGTLSYIDESLTPGEVVLYRTRLHWTVLFWPLLVALFFAAGAFGALIAAVSMSGTAGSVVLAIVGGLCAVIAVSALAAGLIRRSSTEMAVTNRRVLMKSGIISRKTVELMLSKVESIGINQNMLGRLVGYGSVIVRGSGGTYELFDQVARPLEFRRQVQQQIDQLQHPSK